MHANFTSCTTSYTVECNFIVKIYSSLVYILFTPKITEYVNRIKIISYTDHNWPASVMLYISTLPAGIIRIAVV